MPQGLILSRYPALVLFAALAVCAMAVAWLSFGLINLAMANADFLRKHGLQAIAEGGLLQTLSLAARGLILLLAYLGFKGIEAELIDRWRNGSTRSAPSKPDQL